MTYLEYFPDILMLKKSFLDRAKELFTDKFTPHKALSFYKTLLAQEKCDYKFHQWQSYEEGSGCKRTGMIEIERDYERERRKGFGVVEYDASEYLEYRGELCSKLKLPQGIGKMVFRSGEVQEGWFDMGSLR